MRKALLLFFICFGLGIQAQPEEKAVQQGFSLLHALIEKNGDRAFSYLDTSVQSQISPSSLATLWRQVELGLQLGKYLDTLGYLYEAPSLFIGLEFEKGAVDLKVNF